MGYCNTSESIYDGIKKIEAGSYLEFNIKNKQIRKSKWWEINLKVLQFKNKNDYFELILEKFLKAIKNWSKNQMCQFFMVSGGLDFLIAYFI